MKTRSVFTTTLLLFSTFIFSQTASLNQFDPKGEKDGKWILYLDPYGNKLKDSTNAAYWRYTYYDHGTHIYPMGPFIDKNGRIESDSKQSAKIKMLDGEYKCYENGKIKFIHKFKDGEYVFYKEFDTSGQLRTYFDYTKHFAGQAHSWYMITYDKTGKITYEDWTKKDGNGNWPKMKG